MAADSDGRAHEKFNTARDEMRKVREAIRWRDWFGVTFFTFQEILSPPYCGRQ